MNIAFKYMLSVKKNLNIHIEYFLTCLFIKGPEFWFGSRSKKKLRIGTVLRYKLLLLRTLKLDMALLSVDLLLSLT